MGEGNIMQIIYEAKTSKSFEEAIESIKGTLSTVKFGVLWELNIKDKLNEKGVDFDKNFKVLEVCNPHKAKEVLDKTIEVGYFLPCKIGVYEKEGSTFIGMTKPTQLVGMLENEELVKFAVEVEADLKKAIDAAV